MWKSLTGRSSERSGPSGTGSRRSKDEGESSTSRRRSESVSTSKSVRRKSSRTENGFNPMSSSYSSTTKSAYTGTAAPSVASSYATANTRNAEASQFRPPNLVRNESMADRVYGTRDDDRSSRRSRDRSSSGERSRSKRDPERKRTGSKDRDERRRKSSGDNNRSVKGESFALVRSPDLSYSNGQLEHPDLDAHVQTQFPGVFPSTFSQPYRPSGLATEYYGDNGESVASQPGIRPNQPSVIAGAEPHLHTPTVDPRPPAEPSSLGQVGQAASFYSLSEDYEASQNGQTSKPSKTSKSGKFTRPSRKSSNNRPSSRQSPPLRPASMAAAGAVDAGLAAEYYNSQQTADTQYYDTTYQTASPGFSGAGRLPSGGGQDYSRPPKKSDSDTPLYSAAAAAGLSGGAYYANHANHHTNNHNPYGGPYGGSSGGLYAGNGGPTATPMMHRHKHQGPVSKIVDFFKDPESVGQFEEYTEYIGVCRYCFEPGTSPRDAPRKHHYKRRSSGSRYGSTTRVDKLNRYPSISSDEERRKKPKGKSWLATGATAYGLGKVAQALFNNKDFDDTYSVKSGRPVRESDERYGDDYRTSRVEIREDFDNRRSDQRRDSKRNVGLRQEDISAAEAALIGGATAAGLEKRRRRSRSPKKKQRDNSAPTFGSYVDLSRTQQEEGGFTSFFSAPSANIKSGERRKKKKSLFTFSNSSSSSTDADLAFGSGYLRRKGSKREKERYRGKDDNAAIIALGATAAGLAAASAVHRPHERRYKDAYAVQEKRKSENQYDRKSEMRDDEEGWEDASDEDDANSVDSGLVYGVTRRGSNSSLGSNTSGTDKWEWRWKKQKNNRMDRKSSPGMPETTGLSTVSNYPFGDTQRNEIVLNARPLQEVYPIQTSDPNLFETVRNSSIESPAVSRAGSIPLQQPQPVSQIGRQVYGNQVADHSTGGSFEARYPAILEHVIAREPLTESPTQIGYSKSRRSDEDVSSDKKGHRRRETSPAALSSRDYINGSSISRKSSTRERPASVTFSLPEESRWRTAEDDDADISRRKREEREDRRARRKAESEERRSQVGQIEDEPITLSRGEEIDRQLRTLYGEQQQTDSAVDSKPSTSWVAPVIAGAAAAAAGAAIVSASQEDEQGARRSREEELRAAVADESKPERSESLQRRLARMAAERVKSSPSPLYEDYGEFFTPEELRDHLKDHNGASQSRQGSGHAADEGAHFVEITPASPKFSFPEELYRPFGLDAEDDPTLFPWQIPRLQLQTATPSHSTTESVRAASPITEVHVQPTEEPEVIVEVSPKSPGSRVSWGEDQFHQYDVVTPEEERQGFIDADEDKKYDSPPSDTSEATRERRRKRRQRETQAETEHQPELSRETTAGNSPTPPSNVESDEVPGAYGNDLEFAAALAAGAQAAGFDPEIVIDDPKYHRRDSPPGSEGASSHRVPFAEVTTDHGFVPSGDDVPHQQGFIEGEVTESPTEGADFATKEIQDTAIGSVISETSHAYEQGTAEEPTRELSHDPTDTPKLERYVLEEATNVPLPSSEVGISNTKSTRDDDYYENTSQGPESPKAWEDATPRRKSKKKKSKRASEIFDDDAVSVAASAPGVDEFEGGRKSRRKSKRDSEVFDDDNVSVVSSPVTRKEEVESKRKSKDKKSSGLFGGLFGVVKAAQESEKDKDDTRSVRSEPRNGDYDDFEEPSRRRKKKSRDKGFDDVVSEIIDRSEDKEKEASENGEPLKEERPEMPAGNEGVSGLETPLPPSLQPSGSLPSVELATRSARSRSISPIPSPRIPLEPFTPLGPGSGDRMAQMRQRRLSEIRTSDTGSSPLFAKSPTAVPIHFRRPPISPSHSRSGSTETAKLESPQQTTPLSLPRGRKERPRSTEFKSSKEFRPLYLLERHTPSKLELEPEGAYPPLPASKESSVYGSTEDLTVLNQADESPSISKSQAGTPDQERADAYWANNRSSSPDYLDSQQVTPKATEFPPSVKKEKPNYEFHSPSELLQDPSQIDAEDAGQARPVSPMYLPRTESTGSLASFQDEVTRPKDFQDDAPHGDDTAQFITENAVPTSEAVQTRENIEDIPVTKESETESEVVKQSSVPPSEEGQLVIEQEPAPSVPDEPAESLEIQGSPTDIEPVSQTIPEESASPIEQTGEKNPVTITEAVSEEPKEDVKEIPHDVLLEELPKKHSYWPGFGFGAAAAAATALFSRDTHTKPEEETKSLQEPTQQHSEIINNSVEEEQGSQNENKASSLEPGAPIAELSPDLTERGQMQEPVVVEAIVQGEPALADKENISSGDAEASAEVESVPPEQINEPAVDSQPVDEALLESTESPAAATEHVEEPQPDEEWALPSRKLSKKEKRKKAKGKLPLASEEEPEPQHILADQQSSTDPLTFSEDTVEEPQATAEREPGPRQTEEKRSDRRPSIVDDAFDRAKEARGLANSSLKEPDVSMTIPAASSEPQEATAEDLWEVPSKAKSKKEKKGKKGKKAKQSTFEEEEPENQTKDVPESVGEPSTVSAELETHSGAANAQQTAVHNEEAASTTNPEEFTPTAVDELGSISKDINADIPTIDDVWEEEGREGEAPNLGPYDDNVDDILASPIATSYKGKKGKKGKKSKRTSQIVEEPTIISKPDAEVSHDGVTDNISKGWPREPTEESTQETVQQTSLDEEPSVLVLPVSDQPVGPNKDVMPAADAEPSGESISETLQQSLATPSESKMTEANEDVSLEAAPSQDIQAAMESKALIQEGETEACDVLDENGSKSQTPLETPLETPLDFFTPAEEQPEEYSWAPTPKKGKKGKKKGIASSASASISASEIPTPVLESVPETPLENAKDQLEEFSWAPITKKSKKDKKKKQAQQFDESEPPTPVLESAPETPAERTKEGDEFDWAPTPKKSKKDKKKSVIQADEPESSALGSESVPETPLEKVEENIDDFDWGSTSKKSKKSKKKAARLLEESEPSTSAIESAQETPLETAKEEIDEFDWTPTTKKSKKGKSNKATAVIEEPEAETHTADVTQPDVNDPPLETSLETAKEDPKSFDFAPDAEGTQDQHLHELATHNPEQLDVLPVSDAAIEKPQGGPEDPMRPFTSNGEEDKEQQRELMAEDPIMTPAETAAFTLEDAGIRRDQLETVPNAATGRERTEKAEETVPGFMQNLQEEGTSAPIVQELTEEKPVSERLPLSGRKDESLEEGQAKPPATEVPTEERTEAGTNTMPEISKAFEEPQEQDTDQFTWALPSKKSKKGKKKRGSVIATPELDLQGESPLNTQEQEDENLSSAVPKFIDEQGALSGTAVLGQSTDRAVDEASNVIPDANREVELDTKPNNEESLEDSTPVAEPCGEEYSWAQPSKKNKKGKKAKRTSTWEPEDVSGTAVTELASSAQAAQDPVTSAPAEEDESSWALPAKKGKKGKKAQSRVFEGGPVHPEDFSAQAEGAAEPSMTEMPDPPAAEPEGVLEEPPKIESTALESDTPVADKETEAKQIDTETAVQTDRPDTADTFREAEQAPTLSDDISALDQTKEPLTSAEASIPQDKPQSDFDGSPATATTHIDAALQSDAATQETRDENDEWAIPSKKNKKSNKAKGKAEVEPSDTSGTATSLPVENPSEEPPAHDSEAPEEFAWSMPGKKGKKDKKRKKLSLDNWEQEAEPVKAAETEVVKESPGGRFESQRESDPVTLTEGTKNLPEAAEGVNTEPTQETVVADEQWATPTRSKSKKGKKKKKKNQKTFDWTEEQPAVTGEETQTMPEITANVDEQTPLIEEQPGENERSMTSVNEPEIDLASGLEAQTTSSPRKPPQEDVQIGEVHTAEGPVSAFAEHLEAPENTAQELYVTQEPIDGNEQLSTGPSDAVQGSELPSTLNEHVMGSHTIVPEEPERELEAAAAEESKQAEEDEWALPVKTKKGKSKKKQSIFDIEDRSEPSTPTAEKPSAIATPIDEPTEVDDWSTPVKSKSKKDKKKKKQLASVLPQEQSDFQPLEDVPALSSEAAATTVEEPTTTQPIDITREPTDDLAKPTEQITPEAATQEDDAKDWALPSRSKSKKEKKKKKQVSLDSEEQPSIIPAEEIGPSIDINEQAPSVAPVLEETSQYESPRDFGELPSETRPDAPTEEQLHVEDPIKDDLHVETVTAEDEWALPAKKSKKDKKKKKQSPFDFAEDSIPTTPTGPQTMVQEEAASSPPALEDKSEARGIPIAEEANPEIPAETAQAAPEEEWAAFPTKKSKKDKKKKRQSELDYFAETAETLAEPSVARQPTEMITESQESNIQLGKETAGPVVEEKDDASQSAVGIPDSESKPIVEADDEWAIPSRTKSKKDKKKDKKKQIIADSGDTNAVPSARPAGMEGAVEGMQLKSPEDVGLEFRPIVPETESAPAEDTPRTIDDTTFAQSAQVEEDPAVAPATVGELVDEWATFPAKKSKKNKRGKARTTQDLEAAEIEPVLVHKSDVGEVEPSVANEVPTIDKALAPEQAEIRTSTIEDDGQKIEAQHALQENEGFETPSRKASKSKKSKKKRQAFMDWDDEPSAAPAERSKDVEEPFSKGDFGAAAAAAAVAIEAAGSLSRRQSKEKDLENPEHDVMESVEKTSVEQPTEPGPQKSIFGPFDDSATKHAENEEGRDIYRDSAVVMGDSPLLAQGAFHQIPREHDIRDSGYMPSPILSSSLDANVDKRTSDGRPPRPTSPTSSSEDVRSRTINTDEPTRTTVEADPNYDVTASVRQETPRRGSPIYTPERLSRKPTPVDSTSKDRSSGLFDSSPSNRALGFATPEQEHRLRRPPSGLRRSPSIHGHHSSHGSLAQAYREHSPSRSTSSPIYGIDQAKERTLQSATVSPPKTPLGTIVENTDPSRDFGAKEKLGFQPPPIASLRRRTPEPNAEASSSTYDPVNDKGKGLARDMVDVYDGWGEAPGSPLSPTRPASVRKRRSIQHMQDLEARLEQLVSENRLLATAKVTAENQLKDLSFSQNRSESTTQEALQAKDSQLREKDADIERLRETLAHLQNELARLTQVNDGLQTANFTLASRHEQRVKEIEGEGRQAHERWQESSRDLENLRVQHSQLSAGMEEIVKHEVDTALAAKDQEIARLQYDLEVAKDKIRELQQHILASKQDEIIEFKDEDYFETACQNLCQHVKQWVLRFSKFSDTRMCRAISEVRDEKIVDRFDNAVLDGSEVDEYLLDRVKRRDVFMSVVMTMIFEYIFSRYLFGMDREQRQKIKQLEKQLSEIGPQSAVNRWRALTLTLLGKRPQFQAQRLNDTEAVVLEIYNTLAKLLPPPHHLEKQILDSLRNVMKLAVDLSIEMRTQKAEYIMLPPLQPEYDINGDLARKVYFNSSLMNERSGETTSNQELEAAQAVVRMVLFPLVVKKGSDEGEGDDEIVVCPAQVLVARPDSRRDKKSRVLSGGQSVHSLAPSSMDMGNMI